MGKSKELATLTDAGGSFSGNLSIDTGATDNSSIGGGSLNIVSSTNTASGATLKLDKKSADKQNYMSFDQDVLFLGTDANSTDHANIGGKAGVDLRLFAGGSTRMTIDASGRMTMPYQPSFYAFKLVNQFSLSSYSYFDFPSTYYNTGGHYNTSTSRFTAPVNGIYSIHFNVIQLGAVSNMDIAMVVNAGYFYGGRVHLSKSNTGWSNIQWHGNVRLSAGDWIAPYTASGGDFHATEWARFSGHLLG